MNDIKRYIFDNLVGGDVIRVALDPRRGARLPAHLAKEELLFLDLSLLPMPIPIQDLRTDENGITATLHFEKGGFFPVFVPWDAVLGMTNHAQTFVCEFAPETKAPAPPKPKSGLKSI
jgi:hypothetical protein